MTELDLMFNVIRNALGACTTAGQVADVATKYRPLVLAMRHAEKTIIINLKAWKLRELNGTLMSDQGRRQPTKIGSQTGGRNVTKKTGS